MDAGRRLSGLIKPFVFLVGLASCSNEKSDRHTIDEILHNAKPDVVSVCYDKEDRTLNEFISIIHEDHGIAVIRRDVGKFKNSSYAFWGAQNDRNTVDIIFWYGSDKKLDRNNLESINRIYSRNNKNYFGVFGLNPNLSLRAIATTEIGNKLAIR